MKKSQNSRNQCFSYYFCLMIEGSGSRSGAGSVSLTNRSGSGMPKKYGSYGIRIRKTADKWSFIGSRSRGGSWQQRGPPELVSNHGRVLVFRAQ
jgi:hypothetical protein